MKKITTYYAFAMLVLSPAAFATTFTTATGSTGSTTTTTTASTTTITSDTSGSTSAATTDPSAGSFEALSPGNQRIARSLMDAQVVPSDGGEIWTLDQIAAAKSGTGWGKVFREMRSEGLVDAKNLGQVVSSYARTTDAAMPGSATVATTTEEGQSGAAEQDGQTDSSTTTSGGTQSTGETASAFDKLSPGNQKIARSLMNAQNLPDGSTAQPWDLDQIAAAKSGTGWGKVFSEMRSEGLIDAKNLGQVVSQYQRTQPTSAVATTSATLAATAGSAAIGHEDHGVATSHAGSSDSGIVTASAHASGHAYGLESGPVSASDDVTTASGQSIGTGLDGAELAQAGGHASAEAAGHAAGDSTLAASSAAPGTTGAGVGQGHAYGRSR